jgi:hypothetical protein
MGNSTVDPAFTAPERPAFFTQQIADVGEVEALLADRARLRGFLAGGYRLYRAAMSRTWSGADQVDFAGDPSYGQRSTADARRALLDLYQFLWTYGPVLLLVIDDGLLDGAVQKAYREAQRA